MECGSCAAFGVVYRADAGFQQYQVAAEMNARCPCLGSGVLRNQPAGCVTG